MTNLCPAEVLLLPNIRFFSGALAELTTETAAAGRMGGNSSPWTGSPPIPAIPVMGRAIRGSVPGSVSSLNMGTCLGLTNVVEDRTAASLRSSYRLGGYSESAVEISRLMLSRLGDGASGGRDPETRGTPRVWTLAVTATREADISC